MLSPKPHPKTNEPVVLSFLCEEILEHLMGIEAEATTTTTKAAAAWAFLAPGVILLALFFITGTEEPVCRKWIASKT